MEARATLHETDLSKTIGVMLAISVALALGTASALIANRVAGSTAAPTAHFAQVTSRASDPGFAWNYTVRRGGAQSVEGPAAPATTRFTESHGH